MQKTKSFYSTAKKIFTRVTAIANGIITKDGKDYIVNPYVSWRGIVPKGDFLPVLPKETENMEHMCKRIDEIIINAEEGEQYTHVVLNLKYLKQAISLLELSGNTEQKIAFYVTTNNPEYTPIMIKHLETKESVCIAPIKILKYNPLTKKLLQNNEY